MIKVNGNTFRTLAEPMYVNGKHVLEAWANGTKVYPETTSGNLIKVKGKATLICQHFHDGEVHPSSYGEASCGPYNSFYFVTASFSIVSYAERGITFYMSEDEIDLHQYVNTHHGSVYGGVLQAVNPLEGAPTIKTKPIKYKTDGYIRSVWTECKVKYHISPVPICGPITQKYVAPPGFHATEETDTVFHPDVDGTAPNYYTYIPVNQTMIGPGEFNDVIFHGEGWSQGSLIKKNSEMYSHGYVEMASGALPESISSYLDYYSITSYGYRYPIIWPYRDKTSEEMVYPTVWADTVSVDYIRIPVTDCLYVGDKDNAPEWAQHVYDTDLD